MRPVNHYITHFCISPLQRGLFQGLFGIAHNKTLFNSPIQRGLYSGITKPKPYYRPLYKMRPVNHYVTHFCISPLQRGLFGVFIGWFSVNPGSMDPRRGLYCVSKKLLYKDLQYNTLPNPIKTKMLLRSVNIYFQKDIIQGTNKSF